ncbi:formyltetrahydrofolate deformylase [Flavobacterium salilacus subsp. salilacus]|uniref:formyltetrahydrofolate deformylase n=1 Tax=Flavobacterium TaxID=237 RepID=UPI00107564FD|nr:MULTISPECIES: formyltetrahydrofolate deformylase [Flavobacterium]KAF2516838.1 formyltetrahydrofolate deformylase [Flavobacterium salilacus subsp. salilacus]MBE1615803.1 formyltetrahydrofolate deformylase [Flavobacterium sp. SaA2.13]
MNRIILQLHCNDAKGIIVTVTNFFLQAGGNIVYIDQYVDNINNMFFMRLECELPENTDSENLKYQFNKEVAEAFKIYWQWYEKQHKLRLALFISKYEHCVYDILARTNMGELNVEIPLIISNHKELEYIAQRFDIPFYHIPFTKEIKDSAQEQQIAILKEHNIEFIVLARYMQIIGPKLLSLFSNQIINIHHSFLPAFPGAKPYHSAYNRGVKIIGATSHYVTEELDEGPIIEQDTIRVSHIHSINDFIIKGRDMERMVLSRAVKLHSERKIMVYGNRTIIFS